MAQATVVGIPDSLVQLLATADARNGLPAGTMAAVMQQEVGGQLDKFIADPAAYHYAADAQGRRIAGHTGKVSTAFGPFGILESTAADPGFGVAPLKDKSLEEQVRFASEYLAARSRKGGLPAGLAGYGEGAGYAKQVAARIEDAPTAPTPASPVPAQAVAPAWAQFTQALPQEAPRVKPADLNFGRDEPVPQIALDTHMPALPGLAAVPIRPDFSTFRAWGVRT